MDFVTEKNPDVIHFSGHGENSDIILEGDDGSPVTVSKSAIIRLLGRCKNLKLNLQNRAKCTPLYLASKRGHTKFVKLLLTAGADPKIICKGGKTALLVAEKYNKRDVIKLLKN